MAPSGSLKVVKGFDGLREYQFGKKEFIHYVGGVFFEGDSV